MSKFVVKKKILLDFLGEDWKEAFLTFSPFSYNDNLTLIKFRKEVKNITNESDDKDIKTMSDRMISILQDKFVEGRGFDGEKLIPVTKDDLPELPQEVWERVIGELQGGMLAPKA